MKKLDPNPTPLMPAFSVLPTKDSLAEELFTIKQPKEISVIFLGTPNESAVVLQELIKAFAVPIEGIKFNIKTVITSPDNKIGRKQRTTPTPVATIAATKAIKTLKPKKINEEFIKDNLADLEADMYILAAYGKILPQKLLDIPRLDTINLHPSLLPKYRGPSPIQSAILNGDSETGITIMQLDEKVDHGPVIVQQTLPLSGKETFANLALKLFAIGAGQLIKILPNLAKGEISALAQDESRASYCKIIKKEDGFFDLNNPPTPEVLDKMIRAYYPWPNAWTRWNGKIVKLFPENKIQIEGKKIMSFGEFKRGYPTFPLV